jgi:hypothetical protein
MEEGNPLPRLRATTSSRSSNAPLRTFDPTLAGSTPTDAPDGRVRRAKVGRPAARARLTVLDIPTTGVAGAPEATAEPAGVSGGRRETRTRDARSANWVVAAGPGY